MGFEGAVIETSGRVWEVGQIGEEGESLTLKRVR